MDIAVIIVSYNTREPLGACLQSLRSAPARRSRRVIVVDNASRDGSEAMIRKAFPEVAVIQSGGNLGFGRANNLALPQAGGAYVVFLNPDTLVRGDALDRMADWLEAHPADGAVGPAMLHPDGRVQELGLQTFPTPWREFVKLLLVSTETRGRLGRLVGRQDPGRSGPVVKLYGGCLMVRKAVLDRIGGFDERFFMYAEDVDLSRRILDAGWTLYYLREAEIVHLVGTAGDGGHSRFSILMRCDSTAKLIGKHQGAFAAGRYRVAVVAGAVARLLGVAALTTAAAVRPRARGRDWRASARKYGWMIQWALGSARPEVKG